MRRAYQRKDVSEDYDYLIKILLLGDSAVGKSSLLLRFSENKFESSFVLTIGVDFKKKIINCCGKAVKLQIWDTAGQERFRTITPAYFRSAMGVVMVYDITNAETYDNTRYWMQNLADYGDPNVQIVLVGNKFDLSSARQVRYRQGRDLAGEFSAPFFETSAKNGCSVEAVFMTLVTAILTQKFPPQLSAELKFSDCPDSDQPPSEFIGASRPLKDTPILKFTDIDINSNESGRLDEGDTGTVTCDVDNTRAVISKSGKIHRIPKHSNETNSNQQIGIALHRPARNNQNLRKGYLTRKCCG